MLITINKYISEIDVNHIKNYKEKKKSMEKKQFETIVIIYALKKKFYSHVFKTRL